MRVVYLHQYFNTPAMAGGTRSYEMARRLVAAGHRVDLLTTWREPTDKRDWFVTEEAGIRVHWLPVAYSNSMTYAERIRAFVRFAWASARKATSLGGDVVFATSTPLTIALPGIYAAFRRRMPMVFEVRDMWPAVPIAIGAIRNPLVIWLSRRLERFTYRYAAHIVALAPGMGEDIVATGIPQEKVTVIPNGCDLDVFATASASQSPRNEFPWLGSRKLVLYAGALGRANGVEYLVRLAGHAARLDPEIRFVVIGEGAEKGAVRASAESQGLLGSVFFMMDALPKRDLVRWLHAADLVVALFAGPRVIWKDAVQNKFFDALAAGKPIANNFDGWQSRIALEAGVGLILDPSNVEAAARQLIAALGDAAWLEAVPARARVLAESQFERGRLAASLERVLRSAAGQSA
jgi:glycosyltransferase involved in cell wall biosynthesis